MDGDGQIVHDLKKNGTVIYYPEKKEAEIVYDDGETFTDAAVSQTNPVTANVKYSPNVARRVTKKAKFLTNQLHR